MALLEVILEILTHADYCLSLLITRVRNVPFAASYDALLSVSFVESSHSDSIEPGRLSAHNGPRCRKQSTPFALKHYFTTEKGCGPVSVTM